MIDENEVHVLKLMIKSYEERGGGYSQKEALKAAIEDAYILAMIYKFGMTYNVDEPTGCESMPWQIRLKKGNSKTTVFGETPQQVCERGIKWLREKS